MGLTNQIGIMQGRLSPRIDGKIQAYPRDTWQKEFKIAQEIGYSAIEWIVENPLESNALMSESGIQEINDIILRTQVRIDYVCADIFMQQPFVRMNEDVKDENIKILNQIIINSKKIGAIGVEIPFVDNSSIKSKSEIDELVTAMQSSFEVAKDLDLKISLETDLDPHNFKGLLEKIDLDFVQANYDIGNSASLGYDSVQELESYGEQILNVHVKDRKLHGSTVALGTGNANIAKVLEILNGMNYRGGITMQAARGEEDIEVAKEQLSYVKNILNELK